MKKTIFILALAAAAATGFSETLFKFSDFTGNVQRDNYSGSSAFQFLTGSVSRTVNEFGYIDLGTDGLLVAHRVRIWDDATSTMIAEATIKAGTTTSKIDGFRYAPITGGPVVLQANKRYVVSAEVINQSGDIWLDANKAVTPSSYYVAMPYVSSPATWGGRWGSFSSKPTGGAGGWIEGRSYGCVNMWSYEKTAAHNPDPYSAKIQAGTPNGNKVSVTLNWNTGLDAATQTVVNPQITRHYLYISAGTEPNFLNVTPVTIAAGGATGTYSLTSLDYDKTYFWRIDEAVNNSLPADPNTIKGPVWTFDALKSVPVVTADPANIWITANNPATFTVMVSSGSPLSYQWYKSADSSADPLTDTKVGTNSNSYTIPSAQVTDDAFYFCVATNVAGSDTSAAARLTVKRLIAHWTFDTTLADASGNGWNGLLADPNYVVSGKINAAIEFFGDRESVNIAGSETAFNFYPYGLTYCAWIKPAKTNGWKCFASKENRTDWIGWECEVNPSGNVYFDIRNAGNTTSTAVVDDGQWHFVSAVIDGENKKLYLYIDGIQDRTLNLGALSALPTTVFIMGKSDPVAEAGPYVGLLDDAWMYNYPLDKYTVAQMFYNITHTNVCIDPYPSTVDLDNNCRIDLGDFAIIASNWLSCGLYPYCP